MEAIINAVSVIHKSRVFDLVREEVVLPNRVFVEMDIVRHPGAAAIVAMKDDSNLIMIEQYRHALGETIWEVPAGTLHKNEDPLDCARRELEEETGFTASSWDKLGVITPLPAYSDETIHVYLASDLSPSQQNLDDDEILQVRETSLPAAIDMIKKGKIKDGKTISSLFLAAIRLRVLEVAK